MKLNGLGIALLLTHLLLLWDLPSQARTKVAFLEVYDPRGKLIQYEPNGRFGHTAIQFSEIGDQWLQSYPGEGVALVSWEQLKKRGVVAEVLEIPVEMTFEKVRPYLGRPFDFWYSWGDESIYCSELLAKIFGIPTEPMKFNRDVWPPQYWKLEGKPGLSPDGVWQWATSQAKSASKSNPEENDQN